MGDSTKSKREMRQWCRKPKEGEGESLFDTGHLSYPPIIIAENPVGHHFSQRTTWVQGVTDQLNAYVLSSFGDSYFHVFNGMNSQRGLYSGSKKETDPSTHPQATDL